jgi:tRNA (guanine37-N1)-methyltransferase
MKIDVITLFPKMFESPFKESIIARAIKNKLIEVNCHDMRKWAWNSYGAVDDRPFGGDVGMLIRVDVIDKALKAVKKNGARVILTSARGKRFTQEDATRLANYDNLVIICGHYEGFDERVSSLVDEEISIGDYVLTGGEIPAMVIIDSVARLLPGVLGKDASSKNESHTKIGYIEYPQYTRPQEYNGSKPPEVLLSGDLKKIKEWQLKQSRSGNDNSQKDKD